jgi:hypothetical protein
VLIITYGDPWPDWFFDELPIGEFPAARLQNSQLGTQRWSFVTNPDQQHGRIKAMDSESLIRSLRDFLAGSSQAVVLEDGMIAFDLIH